MEAIRRDSCDSHTEHVTPSDTGGYFPLAYYVDFLKFVVDRPEKIAVITYAELCWGDDVDYVNSYPGEWQRWRNWVKANRARRDKIYLLIQHDVDTAPQRTMQMLREEQQLGIRSNVMIFNRRIDRALLRDNGRVSFTDYDLDDDYLRSLEKDGFVIGYHCNAYEQAQFDSRLAEEVFEKDIAELRQRFEIKYFSAHGGVRDRNGRSNSCLRLPESLVGSLRWVNTGHSPRFEQNFSDGGAGGGSRRADDLDLRRFVASCEPGHRYRILIHPQYFTPRPNRLPALEPAAWYREAFDAYVTSEKKDVASDEPGTLDDRSQSNLWAEVQLKSRSPWNYVKARVRSAIRHFQPSSRDWPRIKSPIFVRGMSRSGGTLVVTLLDAHPDIAMSYELYPKLLAGRERDSDASSAEFTSESTSSHGIVDLQPIVKLLNKAARQRVLPTEFADKHLRTFFARCNRAGLSFRQVAQLLKQHRRERMDFSDVQQRLRFIERCCAAKMVAEGKRIWGLKCSNQFDDYLAVWPRASFINVIRDGRDVLASQMNTGNFRAVPEDIGAYWAKTHLRFHELTERTGVRAYEIFYEQLVQDPKREAEKLCAFLRVPFDPTMLDFYEQDLTIYQATHLSMDRISKPIDASKIGRYKSELTEEQLELFYSTARKAMIQFGYLDK